MTPAFVISLAGMILAGAAPAERLRPEQEARIEAALAAYGDFRWGGL